MDLSSIIGLLLAIVGVFVGMILKGVSPSALIVPAAMLIIFVGTFGAVAIASPGRDLKNVLKMFGVIFGNKKHTTNEEAIEQLIKFAEIARREGLLALEKLVNEIADPFLKRGIIMINDGVSAEFIEEALLEDIYATEERHSANAQVFTQAGTYAPTLGVLGAVVGLIAALGHMDNIELLGHAIAAAFVATVFGIFTGYVLWHPFANKLRQKSKIEMETKYLIIKGLVAMQNGENPRILKEKLLSYLSVSERNKMGGGGGGE
ncbi:MAG: flagellar motor stator protein MotA [Clostridiales bacterium]|nr:flagellar motor stator protein MotA [Clostridiales bacterium]